MPPEFYKTKQVAEILGLTTHTVQKLARTGQLRARMIGSQWRFPKSFIDGLSHINNFIEEVAARKEGKK